MTRFVLACLDMAGTTVADDGLVTRAFTAAVTSLGVEPGSAEYEEMLSYVHQTMGQSKIEVFRHLFGEETAARQANAAFEWAYADLVVAGEVSPLPGAADTIAALRDAGVRVALTTGFGKSTQDAIIAALGWRDAVDLVICPGDGVRGRPHPDLVLTAAQRLGVDDIGAVVVVGDTPSDIASGLAAKAGLVLGVLTGSGDAASLRDAGAMGILDEISELPAVLSV